MSENTFISPRALLLTSMLVGCSQLPPSQHTPDANSPSSILIQNVIIAGTTTPVDIFVQNGRFQNIGALNQSADLVINGSNSWIAPTFIDSHVHFAYLSLSSAMLDGGVGAAVDLASPEAFIASDLAPMQMLFSGPMITSVNGYPTQSWGANGYGIECPDDACIVDAVEHLAKLGVGVIKMPAQSLTQHQLTTGVEAAHQSQLLTATHAMSDNDARMAAIAGVDVLAHTPTGILTTDTIQGWSNRAVVSTLAAFGGSTTIVNNLQAFHQAGSTILYGTDFGNLQSSGISATEIQHLQNAGLSGTEILASGTSAPADLWGFAELGRISVGKIASFLLLADDPTQNPIILTTPNEVWIAGSKR